MTFVTQILSITWTEIFDSLLIHIDAAKIHVGMQG